MEIICFFNKQECIQSQATRDTIGTDHTLRHWISPSFTLTVIGDTGTLIQDSENIDFP